MTEGESHPPERTLPHVKAPRKAWLKIGGRAAGVGLLLAALAFLAYLYRATQHTVFIELDGLRLAHRTHQREAGAILKEIGLAVRPEDAVEAPSAEALWAGEAIRLQIARPVTILHDGMATHLWTRQRLLRDVLAEAQVAALPYDQLRWEGKPIGLDDFLPAPSPEGDSWRAHMSALRQDVEIALYRAVPFTVSEGGISMRRYTTAQTVGEALYEQGILVYAGDRFYPALDARLSPEMTVYIERAKPATLEVDGTSRLVRSHAQTVREFLEEQGVRLGDQDDTIPERDAPLEAGLHVQVVRVYEEYYVEETPIPFQVRWEPDPSLEIDLREVAEWGREGALRKQVRVHYENGREVHRTEEAEWVAREPVDRVIRYGTKIVLRELETPQGTLTYWRKIRALATSYNAPTAGKAFDHPQYGITRVGWRARRGIIAVDPKVIPLYTSLYVPGYGLGVAADTGSAIKGRHIDLCYNDDDLVLWYRWVDVYLLAPAPPPSQINYLLPNTPKERE